MIELLERAGEGCLRDFAEKAMLKVMGKDSDLFNELEDCLYLMVNGPHFDAFSYKEASEALENADGTKGPHWSLDDARSLMRSKGAALKGCNEYDLAYALNMAWSDYSGILGGEEPVIRVAMAFLNDEDAPEGKAYLYWKRVIKGE